MQPQPPEVPDFVPFWRAVRATVEAVPTVAAVLPEGKVGRWRSFWVGWKQPNGIRVGGWLLEPEGSPTCAVVVGHGYGGREAPDGDCLPPGAVGLFPCMPGFHRSAQPGIPDNSTPHVIHGIQSKETYLIRDCVEATWRAFDVLAQRYPRLSLGYFGSSFGGGVGALAVPWESRCTAAALEVPTFGNHPLRLTIPCTGSGESVRTYHAQHPEVVDVLAYYDAAVAARHIRCPTIVGPADVDPSVPGPGQWSVAEAIPGAVIHRLSAGHPISAEEGAAAGAAYRAFLADKLSTARAARG